MTYLIYAATQRCSPAGSAACRIACRWLCWSRSGCGMGACRVNQLPWNCCQGRGKHKPWCKQLAKRRTPPADRLQVTLDAETRPLLATAKRAAQEVAAWPAWKHTEQPKDTAVRNSPASKKRRLSTRRAREARESANLSAGGRHRIDVSEREAIVVSRLHAPPSGVTAAVNAQMQTPEAWQALWADVTPELRR